MPITATYDTGDYVAGDTITEIHTLTTNAEVPATISFSTAQCEGDQDTCSSGDVTGISTSYQLVTTAMAKNGGSVTWNDDDTVTLNVDTAGDHDTGAANVMVPLNKKVSEVSDMSISLGGSVGDAYAQIMVNLYPGDASSNWAQITKTGSGSYNLWVYTSEYEFVDASPDDDSSMAYTGTASEVQTRLTTISEEATVIGVKGNIWKGDGATASGTVDSIAFDGNTYELNKDDRHELDTTEVWMPPLPGEQFDFQITNDFAIDLYPDTYTITSNVAPA